MNDHGYGWESNKSLDRHGLINVIKAKAQESIDFLKESIDLLKEFLVFLRGYADSLKESIDLLKEVPTYTKGLP